MIGVKQASAQVGVVYHGSQLLQYLDRFEHLETTGLEIMAQRCAGYQHETEGTDVFRIDGRKNPSGFTCVD